MSKFAIANPTKTKPCRNPEKFDITIEINDLGVWPQYLKAETAALVAVPTRST